MEVIEDKEHTCDERGEILITMVMVMVMAMKLLWVMEEEEARTIGVAVVATTVMTLRKMIVEMLVPPNDVDSVIVIVTMMMRAVVE